MFNSSPNVLPRLFGTPNAPRMASRESVSLHQNCVKFVSKESLSNGFVFKPILTATAPGLT